MLGWIHLYDKDYSNFSEASTNAYWIVTKACCSLNEECETRFIVIQTSSQFGNEILNFQNISLHVFTITYSLSAVSGQAKPVNNSAIFYSQSTCPVSMLVNLPIHPPPRGFNETVTREVTWIWIWTAPINQWELHQPKSCTEMHYLTLSRLLGLVGIHIETQKTMVFTWLVMRVSYDKVKAF